MKRMSKYLKIISSVLALLCMLTIGKVYASWKFAGLSVPSLYHYFKIYMDNFDILWEGASTLPRYDNADQLVFLDRLINDKKIGINKHNPDSQININLKHRLEDGSFWIFGKRDHYGSVDENKDGVAELLGEETDLTFVVQAVNGINNPNYTDMYVFTTDVSLGTPGESTGIVFPTNQTVGSPTINIGNYIYPIFRTKLHRDNKDSQWVPVESVRGYAPSAWYQESRTFTPEANEIPCFDINSWDDGIRGDTKGNAIWTFVGDNPIAEVDISGSKENHTVYYNITPFDGPCIIKTNVTGAVLTVKNANGSVVANSAVNSSNINELSFTSAGKSVTYTLEVCGEGNIPLILTAE